MFIRDHIWNNVEWLGVHLLLPFVMRLLTDAVINGAITDEKSEYQSQLFLFFSMILDIEQSDHDCKYIYSTSYLSLILSFSLLSASLCQCDNRRKQIEFSTLYYQLNDYYYFFLFLSLLVFHCVRSFLSQPIVIHMYWLCYFMYHHFCSFCYYYYYYSVCMTYIWYNIHFFIHNGS